MDEKKLSLDVDKAQSLIMETLEINDIKVDIALAACSKIMISALIAYDNDENFENFMEMVHTIYFDVKKLNQGKE